MSIIAYIILFTLLGSVFSLIGGMLLLMKEKLALKISHYLAAFAAGTLLANAFFDLLPESVEHTIEHGGDVHTIFLWVLGGIVIFFLLERFIHWFHHAHIHPHDDSQTKPTVPLVVLGDTMHNFIDGIVIGTTFMISIPLGIVTTLAVAAHEIPQEIGDFGILLNKGMKRAKIIAINVVSAAVSIIGALIAYSIGERAEEMVPVFLAITAGFFIYISLADLIPEIYNNKNKKVAYLESIMVMLGIGMIFILAQIFSHSH